MTLISVEDGGKLSGLQRVVESDVESEFDSEVGEAAEGEAATELEP